MHLDSLYGKLEPIYTPLAQRANHHGCRLVEEVEALASEGVKYMKPFVHAPYARFDLNESGKLLFDDFKTGRLSAEERLLQTAGLVTLRIGMR